MWLSLRKYCFRKAASGDEAAALLTHLQRKWFTITVQATTLVLIIIFLLALVDASEAPQGSVDKRLWGFGFQTSLKVTDTYLTACFYALITSHWSACAVDNMSQVCCMNACVHDWRPCMLLNTAILWQLGDLHTVCMCGGKSKARKYVSLLVYLIPVWDLCPYHII